MTDESKHFVDYNNGGSMGRGCAKGDFCDENSQSNSLSRDNGGWYGTGRSYGSIEEHINCQFHPRECQCDIQCSSSHSPKIELPIKKSV